MAAKTLNELEGHAWGDPSFDSSLVRTCHHLRTKPVDEFSIEDLRIMISQNIGVTYLVPLAVVQLEREPLAEGDSYPGDLLSSVIGVSEWLKSNPDWLTRVIRVAERASAGLTNDDDTDLRERLRAFLEQIRG